jgi:hypothetical protein
MERCLTCLSPQLSRPFFDKASMCPVHTQRLSLALQLRADAACRAMTPLDLSAATPGTARQIIFNIFNGLHSLSRDFFQTLIESPINPPESSQQADPLYRSVFCQLVGARQVFTVQPEAIHNAIRVGERLGFLLSGAKYKVKSFQ